MSIVIKNAILADIDPIRVERGSLRIEQGLIVERGSEVVEQAGDEVVDCNGSLVLPGLVNGHTHLYSALAVGMPPPPKAPQDFLEILKFVWWRLDQAHDATSIETSARIGAIDALRCGTTTLIDHHASPNWIDGSLDLIEKGLAEVGLRGILCYETTDRHGPAGCEAGLDENTRYLGKHGNRRSNQFAGLVGAHAAFTLEDRTLEQLARVADQLGVGVHIHVAEDVCDEDACNEQHQVALIDRLTGYGLLKKSNIFAHGTHLDPAAIARVNETGLTLAHNPRSNMNNAVGYTPVAQYRCPVMLGTDGIGADMFAEAKSAWFISRDVQTGITPEQVVGMLAGAARRASEELDVVLGKLEKDAAADIVVTDYQPATPLTAANVAGHLIFSLSSRHVRDVIAGGRWAMRDRQVLTVDELDMRRDASRVALELWRRMEQYDETRRFTRGGGQQFPCRFAFT